jgi:predicted outer membrane repeat protein
MNKLLLPFFTDDNLKFRGCIVRSFLVTVTSALLLGAVTGQAATLTVTNSGDSGAGTLRQAILDASSSGGDTINFDLTGTITLTSGQLFIHKNLTISGPGANVLTVRRSSAGNTPEFRIFSIGSGSNVTISGLTIRNGRDYNSGAILNDGATLTVNNCVFTANSGGGYGGGGIMNDGSNANSRLTVNDCVFDGNSADFMAGGILNFSTGGTANLTVNNCTFSNNSAFDGGGIVNYISDGTGTAIVSNTTLTGNSASEQAGRAGAIHNNAVSVGGRATLRVSNCTLSNNSTDYAGGGIYNTAGNLQVSNSTFSGNSASGNGGGIYTEYDRAAVPITNCTFSGNSAGSGGGIYCQGDTTVTVGNTIFNSGASGENIYNAAHFVSADHNLSNDAAGGDNGTGPGGLLNQPGDIRNTDPRLGPLADNGGPTKTMALLSNSPAIDAGNDANAPPRDQRGYLRNGTSDIGAFEFGGIVPAALGNISTRAFVQTGDNVMIGGFIVQGTGPKRVIIRAIGPELGAPPYNIPNALANPRLELHDAVGVLIGSNDDWQHTIIGGVIPRNQVTDIQNSGHAPANPFESAIIADLPPGNYTAIVSGVNNTAGVGLVEVYDLGANTASILDNISTRSFVQTADNVMIGGFIVQGTGTKKVIIRAIGPELGAPPYNIPDALANPTLELHNGTGDLIASNDNWRTTIIGGIIMSSQVRDILSSGRAPADGRESAIIAELPPGNYTAIVRGVNDTTGVGLVEVYDLQ